MIATASDFVLARATACDATAWLAAIPTAIAAIELLQVRSSWRDDGVWGWSILRRELPARARALRRMMDALLGATGFTVVLALQLGCALALPWASGPWPAAIAWACVLAGAFRFRGAYHGGADAMLLVVLGGLALARCDLDGALGSLGLAYVAVQLVLSYFIAGLVKLREPSWRSGAAMHEVLALPQYRAPNWARRWLDRPAIARGCAWIVVGFECLFPLALFDPRAAVLLGAVAIAFHAANVAVLGLNRFLWTWLAAYPALAFVCTDLLAP